MDASQIYALLQGDVIASILSMFALGMLMNRIRGGLLTQLFGKQDEHGNPLDRRTRIIGKIGKPLNGIIFGLALAYLQDTHGFGRNALWHGLSMIIGCSWGWGVYIGAIVKRIIPAETEVTQIDEAVIPLANRPVLWGVAALTLRGLLWGACIALSVHSFIPAVAGALMGCAYYATITISGMLPGKLDDYHARLRGWARGEILFGGIMWAGSAAAIIRVGSLCVNN